MKRKISECINIQINVGNYQHIAITKYAEEEIEYSSEVERTQKEDALTASLVESMTRSMKAIPEKLGKGVAEAIEVEQAIKKTIPEWLAKNIVPNIANNAKKQDNKIKNEQFDQLDKKTKLDKETRTHIEAESKPILSKSQNENDLFEDDSKVVATETDMTSTKDFFSDTDDLFGDK
jgi:hypothetical protein